MVLFSVLIRVVYLPYRRYDVSAVDVVIAIVVWSSLLISLNISPSETIILSNQKVDKVVYTGYGLALEVFSVSRISIDIQSQLL